MSTTIPVRAIFRSKSIQYPLLAAMKAANAWERAGLAPEEIPYVKGATTGDTMLLDGKIDFILGSHVTPYLRYDEGKPFVYLGQTVNWVDDVVVANFPIQNVEQLRNRRIADGLDAENHPHGNHMLYLRRAGIAPDEVQWVEKKNRSAIAVILSGEADAAFVSPPDDHAAQKAGLSVCRPPWLPMVNASTLTTTWKTVADSPELCRRMARAFRLGIAYFQDESEAMMRVMAEEVAPELGLADTSSWKILYERNARLLERTLYPHPLAIANAFELAVMQRPSLAERLVATALWDVHFLRQLDAEGSP